mmetsp:Transcript_20093/g.51777  ORF Transcript_20093/g.51777 Transcript_20093/m.51777 type:complete len:264 (-) Transcript_20093:25-816(-)
MSSKMASVQRIEVFRPAFYDMFLSHAGRCAFSDGLEVGALHNPARIPTGCKSSMLYVDQATSGELQRLYPEVTKRIRAPSSLDDGGTLAKIATESRGFLIASHVIEHMPRTVAAIRAWLRVVRRGGLVLITAPYQCVTFDEWRLSTHWTHFLADDRVMPSNTTISRMWEEHLPEWTLSHMSAGQKNGPTGDPSSFNSTLAFFKTELENLKRRGGIHFHTWTRSSWADFWNHMDKKVLGSGTVRALGWSPGPIMIDLFAVLVKR